MSILQFLSLSPRCGLVTGRYACGGRQMLRVSVPVFNPVWWFFPCVRRVLGWKHTYVDQRRAPVRPGCVVGLDRVDDVLSIVRVVSFSAGV